MLSVEEIFPMYKTCKDSKDQGGFHDFVEIMKLYDKNNDNTMIKNELYKLLTMLGEKMSKQEAKDLMKELCEPEDEDGFMPFIRKYSIQQNLLIHPIDILLHAAFLERMCAAEK